MNFKLNTKINLADITKYANTQSTKINYNLQEKGKNSCNNFEEEFITEKPFIKSFASLADSATSSLENISQQTFPQYNYQTFTETDLENMYNLFNESPVSSNTPAADLASTNVQTVENFNQIIKNNVNAAGYGSREGVVAAALSLVVGYPSITGRRLRYSMNYRQVNAANFVDQEGIVNEDFYLDCSSFAMWALYNGGYSPPLLNGQPVSAYTGSQITWASQSGMLTEIENGKPGDFLIRHQGENGHIVMIIGQYNDGYYCVEFSSPENGGLVTKRTYEDLHSSNYSRIDMESYYSNQSNVRK